jgi:hypothetical protein
LIASGLVKLFFNRVIAAWRSAAFNELINSSIVGVGDGDAFELAVAVGEVDGIGDCGRTLVTVKSQRPMQAGKVNRNISASCQS